MALLWFTLITSAALTVSFYQYKNEANLYRITQIRGEVKVVRDGEAIGIPHDEVVPGDVVIVEDGVTYCDMVVVSSKCALIDESALTGESNPVGKTAVDPSQGNVEFSSTRHKRNLIFAGTTVLETDGTRAIVTKTASFTARGVLIRDIFSQSRHRFKFDVEVPIVLTIFFVYAVIGFFITVHLIGEGFVYGYFYGIYVVVSIMPPLLPTVFTVSVGVSNDRLAAKKVTCTNAESILVAGKVTRAFFDKTGTLTKQGLDFLSVRSATEWNREGSFISDPMSVGMAVCHTLIKSKSGAFAGNPVDKTMFEASGANLDGVEVTSKNGQSFTILKQFDFDHHSMTQSTIIKTAEGQILVYVKGSGENMKLLCTPESIPSDFDAALRDSAINGIYQITMAGRILPPTTDLSTLLRGELEDKLVFFGVINFKNTIRAESPDVIRQLSEGEIESIMITGDSVLTGVCIAREAGIFLETESVLIGGLSSDSSSIEWKNETFEAVELPSIEELKFSKTKLALSAEALAVLLSTDVSGTHKLMDFIRVYGRCTPFDKVAIVDDFVKVRSRSPSPTV